MSEWRPEGFTRPQPPATHDLMIYDEDPHSNADVRAATVDVLGWISVCQIEFNAM
jgi:hypothetical protein